MKRTKRRRSIALTIDTSGRVMVLAPRFALTYFIERFVQKRADWIKEKLAYFETLRLQYPEKQFVQNELFPAWGIEYPLMMDTSVSAVKSSCELQDGRFQMVLRDKDRLKPDAVKALLRVWYWTQTETRLREAVPRWAAVMNIVPGRVTVANQKKRWGSCSGKGNLRFNWRLSMMPTAILDYVVVHELAHIQAPDHSRRFWSIVNEYVPDSKQSRAWLRHNGGHLAL